MIIDSMIKNITQGIRKSGSYFVDELRIVLKDPGVILMFVVAILAYPVIYSIAYQNELIRDIPVALVDHDHSALSRQYARMVDATQQIKVEMNVESIQDAKKAFYEGTIMGIVLIPSEFEKGVVKGEQTSVSVYGDASYFLFYKQTLAGALYSCGTFSAGVEVKRLLAGGNGIDQAIKQRDPLSCKIYSLYNPSSGYGSFVMPGLIIIILQQTLLIGIGMIGGARKESNSSNILSAVSMQRRDLFPALLGKSGVYLFIYLLDAVFVFIWVYHWFGFPDKGKILDVFILLIPFFLSVSFLGLAISVFFTRREHSIIFLVFLSPIVLFLSGLSWPASEIPVFLYWIAHIFPSTMMIPAYLRIRTMGVGLDAVSWELLFMMGQTIVYFFLAYFTFRNYTSRASKSET